MLTGKVRDLPLGWRWTTMGDIADVAGGGTPHTTEPTNFEGGTIPWVTPADLSGYKEKYISHGSRYITRRGLESSSARLLPAGTVLFSSRAPIGYVAIARNPIATNQGFKSFVLKDGVLPEYAYWWLKGSKRLAESLASGTTFLEISGANAKKIPIPIAPIEEQREIVAEIETQYSRLDEAVVNLKRTGVSLKHYKAAVLKAAVEGRLLHDRPVLVEASFRRIPDGWRVSTVGEIAKVGTGATPKRGRADYWNDGRVPWVTSSAVNHPLIIEVPEFITEKALRETNCTVYPPGTLLLAMYGEGKTRGMCSELGVAAATNQALAAIQARAELNPYLKIVLQNAYESTRRVASGGVQPNLNLSLVRAIEVPLPPREEQVEIVSEVQRRISFANDIETQCNRNLIRAERLRSELFRKHFSQHTG
jgi:type I restriction enzyme, S subunit